MVTDEMDCYYNENYGYVTRYIEKYTVSCNCVPDWVQPRPTNGEEENLLSTFQKLLHFNYRLLYGDIKIPIKVDQFINDKELLQIIEKFDPTLNLEKLYYLMTFIFDYAKLSTVESLEISLNGSDQLDAIFGIIQNEDVEITFKSGKKKFVLTDRRMIDFIFNIEKWAKTLTADDLKVLQNGMILSGLTDYSNDSYSYSEAAAVFVGYMYQYFNKDNKSKELISYLAYISKLVMNDSIITSKDYINILLKNYKLLDSGKKKGLGMSIVY